MTATRVLPVVLAGGALVAVVAGALLSVPRTATAIEDDGRTRFFSGVYSPVEPLLPAYVTLENGEYQLTYSMDVRVTSPQPGLQLNCGFVDANGVVGYLARGTPTVVPATGVLTRVEYTGRFRLPEITVAVRCLPSTMAVMRASFTNITIHVNKRA